MQKKVLGTRNCLKHRRVSFPNVSVLWDKNFLSESRYTPSYSKMFSIPELFWNTEGFLYETFWYYETKNAQRKIVKPPYRYKSPKSTKHWNTEGFIYETVSYCAAKFSDKQPWYSSLSTFFSIPEAFWNTVGFIYGPFRYCETWNFRRNRDKQKKLEQKNIWNTEGFLYE